jgi:hypothetical protein
VSWFEKLLIEQTDVPVKLRSVRVTMIDGKSVLNASGNFNYPKDKTEFESIFADVDNTTSFLQRIYFAGAAKDFDKYKAEAQKIFESIVWIVTFPDNAWTKK